VIRIESKRMKWVGHVACVGEIKHAYNVFVGRPEGWRPLGRTKLGWEESLILNKHGGKV
jgi:hypothetical protein